MQKAFNVFNITTTILSLLMMFYFPIVWLNFTFTFNDLTANDIPFYYTCNDNGNLPCKLVNGLFSANRLGLSWWFFAFDILMIFALFIPYILILIIEYGKKAQSVLVMFFCYILPLSIITALQWIRIVYNFLFVIFCESAQLCRNFNSNSNPNIPNWIFITQFVFNFVFCIILTYYCYYSKTLNSLQIKKFSEKKDK